MSDIVVLSDSNESVSSAELIDKQNNVEDKNEKRSLRNDVDLSDFEFPEVQFYHDINEDRTINLQNAHDKGAPPNFNSYVSLHRTSDEHAVINKNSKQNKVKKSLYNATDSSDSVENSDVESRDTRKQRKDKTVGKKDKGRVIKERLKRQEQLMKERVSKALASKKSKNIKPGECMKFIEVVLDKASHGEEILKIAMSMNLMKYVQQQMLRNSRLINSSQELALMVYQCTKAIAEIPYKLEKSKNLTDKFDWYVMGDNRNTVRVDKDGNGLKRLWQQQLCQFHLSSLEIAEAICSVYPSPAHLIEAYTNCTDNEGVNLLKDIPIRRAAGPLTTVRKVGSELSKKIYLTFMSRDGENILS
ncbi:Crossover junction endonuclease EME1 [Anthophora plagiata]